MNNNAKQTAPVPSDMAAVNYLLRKIPADSRRTFQRAFQVLELLASVAFAPVSVVKGAIATGAIKDGSGSGSCIEKILKNCPFYSCNILCKGQCCH